MALDPAVEALIDSGQFSVISLVRFDLPGKTVGYHTGGRPHVYNGLTYLPNRWLDMGSMRGDLGIAVSAREIVFSNMPVDDPDDAIARIEEYDYLNAPVIISHLAGVPESNEVLGVIVSWIYEINEVRFATGAMDKRGKRTLTTIVELEPPSRSARGSTGAKRSTAEQQFDNGATDTFYEYAATEAEVPEQWGQITR